SEVRNLEGALGPLKPRRVYADKGYYSSENKELLRRKGIKNGIMYKAARNKGLSRLEKVFNRLVVTDIW
ncbi:transposase, partial [Rickettsiales endosymbiont of Peranema trichophorum]